MTMTLDRPPDTTPDQPSTTTEAVPPAERLRTQMAGVRLGFTWLGVRRALSPEQKNRAAHALDASGDYVAASKKLLDTRHPAFRNVTAIRSRATALWKGVTLPFPEPGLRLVKREELASLNEKFAELANDLAEAVEALAEQYNELREAAHQWLGRLYDAGDYPANLSDAFAMTWDFPSIEPPDYLLRLRPELYERERQRIAARFDEAVELAEQAFLTEFSGLITHLAGKLEGNESGRPQVFRDSAIENLRGFFQRFGRLSIGSSDQLQELVAEAKGLLAGVQPSALRGDSSVRATVARNLSSVQAGIEGLMVDRPRRNLIRSPR